MNIYSKIYENDTFSFVTPKKIGIKILYVLVLSLSYIVSIGAQNYCSLSLKKDTAFIGDPIYVNIKIVKHSNISSINLSPLSKMFAIHDTTQVDVSIESFGKWKVDQDYNVDMNSVVWIDETKAKEGIKSQYAVTQLKIIFWDNGRFRLPQINVKNSMPLESPIVTIFAPQDVYKSAGDSTAVIMPIKTIFKEYRNFFDYLPLLLGVLCLVFLLALGYYFKKKKNTVLTNEVIIPIIPAHIVADKQLDELYKKELWQKGAIKQYQSELTHIIREYLGKRYRINALENTTENIIRSLKKTDFNNDLQSNVSNILQMADMIKFAKAKVTDDIHQTFWEQAKELVKQTKPKEVQQ